MARSGVADLQVFQRAYAISLEVHRASLNWPQIEQYALADQIRRASKSICVNLAEGFAKRVYSQAEFKRFLLMSLGSSDEMQIWSRYVADLGYIEVRQAEGWQAEYREIFRDAQRAAAKGARGC
jgi:four helix bundle protein